MSESTTQKAYSFVFNTPKNTWICSVHGEVDWTGWVPCWNGCQDGYFDGYEEDPLWYDPGDMECCTVCGGAGGWAVCGECCKNNPDVEW
jgi:hypothetical protein